VLLQFGDMRSMLMQFCDMRSMLIQFDDNCGKVLHVCNTEMMVIPHDTLPDSRPCRASHALPLHLHSEQQPLGAHQHVGVLYNTSSHWNYGWGAALYYA
jgi:hypothetical protein